MLKDIKIWMVCHQQAFWDSISMLLRAPVATLMMVVVIALALSLPALFWLLTTNIKQLTINFQQGEQISLYLPVSLSQVEQNKVLQQVRQTAGVRDARYISAAEGLAELQKHQGLKDVGQYLANNPIPAVIQVTPQQQFNTPEMMHQLAEKFKSYQNIDQVQFDLQWVARLHAILSFVEALTEGLIILLGLAVAMIIAHTIRLAVHKRHEQVQILKLIGATDAYIARPFLYSGFWFGFMSAVLALLMAQGFLWHLSAFEIDDIKLSISFNQTLSFTAVATLLGWLSAWVAVKRQLKF